MEIVLVRVDSRLVHGQIIEAWVPYLKANCICVVNDDVASDFFRETVIRMAVPQGVEVQFYGVSDFATSITENKGSKRKAIVLFASVSDANRAYRNGFKFSVLNLGNVYTESCQRRLSACVQLDEAEVASLKELLRKHVRVELQKVPNEKPVNIPAIDDIMDSL
ncbi:MAG: PTS sugar transporter subunit IIB [Syntrophales bacterium]|nr:PTS sugar transporter subunit IIB [Syntrophales bacterium]